MDELMTEFTEKWPDFLALLGRMKMAADRLGGTVYLPRSIGNSIIDACETIQRAGSWLVLPIERVEVKLQKVPFDPSGHFYFAEDTTAYTPAESIGGDWLDHLVKFLGDRGSWTSLSTEERHWAEDQIRELMPLDNIASTILHMRYPSEDGEPAK